MPSQPGGDDGGDDGDGDGGERISKSDPAPFPSRPGMEYRVRLPLTPIFFELPLFQVSFEAVGGYISPWDIIDPSLPAGLCCLS